MKNPHLGINRIKDGEDYWQCVYCKKRGAFNEMRDLNCTYNYEPCSCCGGVPECKPDCEKMNKLIQDIIDSDDFHVVGMGPDEEDTIQ